MKYLKVTAMINRKRIKKPPQFLTKKLTTDEGYTVDAFVAKAKILIENIRQWRPAQTLEFVQRELLEAFCQLPQDIKNLHNELTWLRHPENTSPVCENIFQWLPVPSSRTELPFPPLQGDMNLMLSMMFSTRSLLRDEIVKIHEYSIRLSTCLNTLEKKVRAVEIMPSLKELCIFAVKSSGANYGNLHKELRGAIDATRLKPIERLMNPLLSRSQNEKMLDYYSDYGYAKKEFMLKKI